MGTLIHTFSWKASKNSSAFVKQMVAAERKILIPGISLACKKKNPDVKLKY